MSWRRLEDVFKTFWKRLEDVWLRQICWPWRRCLEDVFWRRRLKTSSSRRMFAGSVPPIQKQPYAYVLQKRCFQNYAIFIGKRLCWNLFLINFIKKRLQHRCFPMNIAKLLRKGFFIEHLQWLLLVFITTFRNILRRPFSYFIYLPILASKLEKQSFADVFQKMCS